jgi:hypothetical protein
MKIKANKRQEKDFLFPVARQITAPDVESLLPITREVYRRSRGGVNVAAIPRRYSQDPLDWSVERRLLFGREIVVFSGIEPG